MVGVTLRETAALALSLGFSVLSLIAAAMAGEAINFMDAHDEPTLIAAIAAMAMSAASLAVMVDAILPISLKKRWWPLVVGPAVFGIYSLVGGDVYSELSVRELAAAVLVTSVPQALAVLLVPDDGIPKPWVDIVVALSLVLAFAGLVAWWVVLERAGAFYSN